MVITCRERRGYAAAHGCRAEPTPDRLLPSVFARAWALRPDVCRMTTVTRPYKCASGGAAESSCGIGGGPTGADDDTDDAADRDGWEDEDATHRLSFIFAKNL